MPNRRRLADKVALHGIAALLGEEAKLLPDLSLVLWQWAALALLPVLAGAAALVTARFTVMRALARMP
mgnify:CR=1 FL=1